MANIVQQLWTELLPMRCPCPLPCHWRIAIALIVCVPLLWAAPALACTASTVSPSVTICSPAAGSSVAAPVHVTALTTDTAHPVTAMKVYLDYIAVYSTSSNSLDTYITPSTTGSHNLTINAWDSAGTVFKASETFTVTSIGTITLAPNPLSFAAQLLGTTSAVQSVAVTNNSASSVTISTISVSSNTGDFVYSGTTCGASLAANSSCTVGVVFTPQGTGTRTGTLSIIDSLGTQTASLTGTGATISVAPASLTFSNQTVGTTSASQTITIGNGAASAAAITVGVSGDFTVASNACGTSVAANGSCTVAVAFAPTAAGTRTGTFTVTDAAGNQTASLSGTGQAAVVSMSPASLNWGSLVVGTNGGAQTATLYNGTASGITINSVSAGSPFVVTTNNCGSTLAVGASCTISVSYQPTAVGSSAGTLTVTDSAGTQTTSLSGSAIASAGPCTPGTTNPSVTICSPAASTTNATPIHLTASTTSSYPITALKVMVDSATVYTIAAPSIDIYVGITGGTHTITVQATNSAGQTFQSSVSTTAQAPAQSWLPCALSTVNQSVTICNPPPNGIVSLPVHLAAGATDTASITQLQVSVDGGPPTYTVVSAGTLDVYLSSLTSGPHTLTVTATNSAGTQYSSSVPVTVSDNSGLSNLQHIILYVQENRSFDTYFGLLGPYRAAEGYTDPVDGLNLNTVLYNASGQPIQPYHMRTMCTEDLGEKWDAVRLAIDNGAMDLFLKETQAYEPSTIDPGGNRSIGYYDQRDIPYYYELAAQFSTSDRYFSSATAPTAPNRMYIFAATSFGYMYQLNGPSGGWTQPTIWDQLDAAGITWKYYLQDSTNFLAQWAVYTKDSSKVFNISQYYADVANNTLPQVAFIEHAHSLGWDEHPIADVQYGVHATAKIINALMTSPSWATSAFILTYDEAGGLYDHVLPPPMIKPDNIKPKLSSSDVPGDFGRMGTRVPIVVVSPWARPHLMSHVWREHTSLLRLIEDRFGVPPLTARDAVADNLMEMFDFTAPAFAVPPPLPVQPTTATCDKTQEAN